MTPLQHPLSPAHAPVGAAVEARTHLATGLAPPSPRDAHSAHAPLPGNLRFAPSRPIDVRPARTPQPRGDSPAPTSGPGSAPPVPALTRRGA
ncbi:hypothetical protein [Nonomuraea polychroma]|uniref:hypothetical protein n=1 Tax=Nonomuraea polychroma TaxID=46176 RepID=UPI000FDF21E9|nr:hypothetical protein [Nonomuraea polychroma]